MSDHLLRSATDGSNPGFKIRPETDRAAIARHLLPCDQQHLVGDGAGLLVRACYPAFEGAIKNGPHLRMGLCLGHRVRLMQEVGGSRLEGWWRPGTIAITPPDRSGVAVSSAASMIGLAILPHSFLFSPPLDADHIDHLSRSFHSDPLLGSVLSTLICEAEVHGASSAFFEHGIALVLQRLSELTGKPLRAPRTAQPLSSVRYGRVVDFVSSRLSENLSVIDMAETAGMDPSGFTRAMRARTGLAPFAWLTQYRMQHADSLLAAGQPVMQVAAQVGYANASKFAGAFRRVYGVSPTSRRMRG